MLTNDIAYFELIFYYLLHLNLPTRTIFWRIGLLETYLNLTKRLLNSPISLKTLMFFNIIGMTLI